MKSNLKECFVSLVWLVELLLVVLVNLGLEKESLLLEQPQEQGTFAQPIVALQQEGPVAAERMWLQLRLLVLDPFDEP
jgi:hypothetical protein